MLKEVQTVAIKSLSKIVQHTSMSLLSAITFVSSGAILMVNHLSLRPQDFIPVFPIFVLTNVLAIASLPLTAPFIFKLENNIKDYVLDKLEKINPEKTTTLRNNEVQTSQSI